MSRLPALSSPLPFSPNLQPDHSSAYPAEPNPITTQITQITPAIPHSAEKTGLSTNAGSIFAP
jgi:hypothetical protein